MDSDQRAVTSEGLTPRAVKACWSVAVLLLGSGIAATFLAGTGAAPAAMILFGSLFLVLALMKRVPLSLEVAGTKFDASYPVDRAYSEGRADGVQRGVEVALTDVERAKSEGADPLEVLRRLLANLEEPWTPSEEGRATDLNPPPRPQIGHSDGQKHQYAGPAACSAAGITYRQLDYWARTGLLEPSGSDGNRRLYTVDDIVLAAVIKRLLNTGVSLQQIRIAAHELRNRGLRDLDRFTLVSDGREVLVVSDPREVLEWLDSGEGIFAISVGTVAADIQKRLTDLPPAS